MFDIEWIKERVRNSAYYFSKHADQERQNDNLLIREVEEALLAGMILEHYEDFGYGDRMNGGHQNDADLSFLRQ
jgi:hypothetical protein